MMTTSSFDRIPDQGFLELYGGLLASHQERRRAHQLKSRIMSSSSSSGEDVDAVGPPLERDIGIDPAVDEITPEEVRSFYFRSSNIDFCTQIASIRARCPLQ
jgi:hypothetical protein